MSLFDIEIKKYKNRDGIIWDKFINDCENGTIFHTRRFIGYHKPDRFKDNSLLFYRNGKLAAVLPAAQIVDKKNIILVSHSGASYGGIIYKKGTGLEDQNALVAALIKYAEDSGISEVRLTLAPIIYHSNPSIYMDFCLFQHGFSYTKREISSVLDLRSGKKNLLKGCSTQAVRAMRKAEKSGVLIKESRSFQKFYPILEKNLSLRHNVKPTHSLDELLILRKLFPGRIRLLAAFLEKTMIAGVMSFICNPGVNLAFYITHDTAYQKYRPVDLLFRELIYWSVNKGFNYLDLGLFTVNSEPNWGLVRFKEKFGTRGIFRDTLSLKLNK